MNEIENYKYMFFKGLYETLNLKDLEQKLENEEIKPLKIVSNEGYEIISHYFFLLNDININALTTTQLQEFNRYFSKEIHSLSEQEVKEIQKFINDTYSLLLFPSGDSKYVYYGPINDDYICPRDAIAIGLYYDTFGDYDTFEVENKLSDIINYIQFDLSKKINKKIAVIPFNQLTLENQFNGFVK